MKLQLIYAVFTCFIIGSSDTKICPQTISLKAAKKCNSCKGRLQKLLGMHIQTKLLNCTFKETNNISIIELTTMKNFSNLQLQNLNDDCTYTVQLDSSGSQSSCYPSNYTCKPLISHNETTTKIQRVEGHIETIDQPVTFKIDDTELDKTNEVILGSSATISCSFVVEEGRLNSIFPPYIAFYQLFHNGTTAQVENARPPKTQTAYQVQSSSEKTTFKVKFKKYTKRLFLTGINTDVSKTFICRVTPISTVHCQIEKRLQLRTRPCKAGYFCDPKSSTELPCKEGTYSNIIGLFNQSGCRTCSLNSYCPSGSPWPIPCPASQFFAARRTTIKVFEGKRNEEECRWCPVHPCDESTDRCSFICGNTRFKGILGQSSRIHCLLSNGTLMRNLSWYKGNKKILGGKSYSIYNGQNEFTLKIHKFSMEDVGDYMCSGIDTVMGNRFNSTVNLDADSANTNFLLLLWIAFAILIVTIVGFVVWRHWRKSTSWSSNDDEAVKLANQVETFSISEAFQSDLRTVLEGNTEEKYDVFICYSSADKTWVRRTLLPTLKDFNLRVCIDFEDFNAGSFIIENVADAIFSSRKTLAVLSPDFLCSAWCQQELMMALTRVRDRHNVIPVMYRSCEVPLFLSDVTYLDWCNEDVRHIFWGQLIRTINDKLELDANDVAYSTNESELK